MKTILVPREPLLSEGGMTVPRFFVTKEQIDGDIVRINGDDAFHISRSLRMAAGEHIVVCDNGGGEYDCVLEGFNPDSVTARVLSEKTSDTEPPFVARVYQGLPKGDKLETVIQKSVECGARSVTPFESEFCVARSKPESESKRTERRNRIAEEAAKQCGRSVLPEVEPTVSFDVMLSKAKEADVVLFCYEGEGTLPLGRAVTEVERLIREKGNAEVAIVVGSEGGFSEKEAAKAREAGFTMCGLGKRILRTETAATFVLCCLVCATELS